MTATDLPVRTAADRSARERITLYEALAAKGMTVGSVVQSLAGHDYGRLAVIIDLLPPFARIVDGSHRPSAKPKVKRLSHLRLVAQTGKDELAAALMLPDEGQRNSVVRHLIRRSLENSATVVTDQSTAHHRPESLKEEPDVQRNSH